MQRLFLVGALSLAGGGRGCTLCHTMGRLSWCNAHGIGCEGTRDTRVTATGPAQDHYTLCYRVAAKLIWAWTAAIRLRGLVGTLRGGADPRVESGMLDFLIRRYPPPQ